MISMRPKSTERLQVDVVILIGQKAEAFLASSHDGGLFLYHTDHSSDLCICSLSKHKDTAAGKRNQSS